MRSGELKFYAEFMRYYVNLIISPPPPPFGLPGCGLSIGVDLYHFGTFSSVRIVFELYLCPLFCLFIWTVIGVSQAVDCPCALHMSLVGL